MSEVAAELGRWGLDERGMREQMYGAPTARERARWHAACPLLCANVKMPHDGLLRTLAPRRLEGTDRDRARATDGLLLSGALSTDAVKRPEV